MAVWVACAATALIAGWDYYQLPLAQRAYDPDHPIFAPTGLVGQGYGVIGTLMIVAGVVLYAARKRYAVLERFGSLGAWLQFHIFLCTLGPFLVLLHTTFKFGGLVSISFWCMMAVVTSGVFGRYVYAWLPRSEAGDSRTAESVRLERERILTTLTSVTELTPADVDLLVDRDLSPRQGLIRAVAASVSFRFSERRAHRRAERLLRDRGVPPAVRGRLVGLVDLERKLTKQLSLMNPFQRLFRYWHAFHLPLAAVMFLVLAVHVAVAIALGYTWIL